jgi:hypothetical protein
MQLPKGVIHNPKKQNRPYGVMVDGSLMYFSTEKEALERLQGDKRRYKLRATRTKQPINGWETRRTICTICKDSIGVGRIKIHEEACKRRAEGYVYVRPDRRVRKRETKRYTHFNSHEIFMEYEGESRSLNEIAKMTNTPLDTLRHRYKRKTKEKTIEYLFGPVIPAEEYTKRTYKKEDDNNG